MNVVGPVKAERELRAAQVRITELEGERNADRETVAQWMIANSYATGHGDTVADLLSELQWQIHEGISRFEARIAELEAERHRLNVALAKEQSNIVSASTRMKTVEQGRIAELEAEVSRLIAELESTRLRESAEYSAALAQARIENSNKLHETVLAEREAAAQFMDVTTRNLYLKSRTMP